MTWGIESDDESILVYALLIISVIFHFVWNRFTYSTLVIKGKTTIIIQNFHILLLLINLVTMGLLTAIYAKRENKFLSTLTRYMSKSNFLVVLILQGLMQIIFILLWLINVLAFIDVVLFWIFHILSIIALGPVIPIILLGASVDMSGDDQDLAIFVGLLGLLNFFIIDPLFHWLWTNNMFSANVNSFLRNISLNGFFVTIFNLGIVVILLLVILTIVGAMLYTVYFSSRKSGGGLVKVGKTAVKGGKSIMGYKDFQVPVVGKPNSGKTTFLATFGIFLTRNGIGGIEGDEDARDHFNEITQIVQDYFRGISLRRTPPGKVDFSFTINSNKYASFKKARLHTFDMAGKDILDKSDVFKSSIKDVDTAICIIDVSKYQDYASTMPFQDALWRTLNDEYASIFRFIRPIFESKENKLFKRQKKGNIIFVIPRSKIFNELRSTHHNFEDDVYGVFSEVYAVELQSLVSQGITVYGPYLVEAMDCVSNKDYRDYMMIFGALTKSLGR